MKDYHFQKKLFYIITSFLFFIFGVLAIGVGIYVYHVSLKTANNLQRENVQVCAERVGQLIRDMDAISVQMVGNATIQSEFLKVAETDVKDNYFENNLKGKKAIDIECSSLNIANNSVNAIYIYRAPAHFFSYNTVRYSKEKVTDILMSNSMKEFTDYGDDYFQVNLPHTDFWADDDKVVISLVRPLIATYYTKDYLGTIQVQKDYSKLEEICEKKEDGNQIAFVVIDNKTGNLVYPYQSDGESEQEYYQRLRELRADEIHQVTDDKGQRNVIYKYDLDICDWSVLGIQEYGKHMYSTRVIMLLIASLCISFCFFTAGGVYLVTRRLTKPIQNLRKALSDITLENVNIQSSYEGNNEIELLQERFQKVLKALQHSAQQVTVSQTAEYQAKIIALQAQINPHFLYNSLMSISAAGQERDALKVQNMCSQLSDIFRYASADGFESTLGEEMVNAKNYLGFMKCRYLDDLNYQIEECRKAARIEVPKLILQPLIENCFLHGFYTIEPPFLISIRCQIKDDMWFIEVADNGGGFTDESLKKLDKVRKRIDEILENKEYGTRIETQELALMNVYARLKVKYGNELVFRLSNGESGGALTFIGGKLVEKES